MGDKSHIQWTDATWNPLAGCTRKSDGCDNCYAAGMALRIEAMARKDIAEGRDPGGKRKYIGVATTTRGGRAAFNGTINLDPDVLDQPLRWTRPRRIFVNSMSDLFHEAVPFAFVARVFTVMMNATQHTFQVLTKRPERAVAFFHWLATCPDAPHWAARVPLDNVWIGTSVENQAAADARIPHLLRVPARVRFLSCEPLLGPVDLQRIPYQGDTQYVIDCLHGRYGTGTPATPFSFGMSSLGTINWVIAGGESGSRARPMHPDWARNLRDQCQAAGVPYFFKQWGEHTWGDFRDDGAANEHLFPMRVGKKRAGRELDGRTWEEFPNAT